MTAGLMDRNALAALLVAAIPDQKLAEVAAQVLAQNQLTPEARAMARSAVAACSAISARMADVQAEAVSALGASGVTAEALGGISAGSALQFHSAGLKIDRRDLTAALADLAKLGFHPPIEMTRARIGSLSRTAEHVQLVRFDEATTRLILHFTSKALSVLPKILRPGIADLGEASLPGGLGALYGFVRPWRLLKERLTSIRSPHHEIDFLGTPTDLIAPILHSLELGKEDVLLDLGCGDGRILLAAAEQFGCRAIGIEHNAELAERAREAAAASLASDLIDVRCEGADTADLSEASVVFMFLPLGLLPDLLPSVKRRMNGSARLVMHEQSRPGARFVADQAIPVFTEEGITVVRVQKPTER